VPGLIEGASEGRGLGHDFLRHVERCAALVHVVDTATLEPDRDPIGDVEVVERELAQYGGFDDRPRLVALNKVDVPDGRDLADLVLSDFAERGLEALRVSAASHEGLRELAFAMAGLVARSRREKPPAPPTRVVLRPPVVTGSGPEFTVRQTGEGWRVRGVKPERWVRQTDFGNDEAVGFLADRLNRLGVEERLLELGAREGDAVLIGDLDDAVVFDFRPLLDAGVELLGRLWEDQRFAERRPAAERRRRIDEAYGSRAAHESRADVARRADGRGDDEPGADETSHDETGHDETGHDETGHDETRHDETRHDGNGDGESGVRRA
jgi:GTP-binding protein